MATSSPRSPGTVSTSCRATSRCRRVARSGASTSPTCRVGQAKYVTVVAGSLIDFVVDLRVGSPTFGQWDSVLLDTGDRRAVYLSEGLGHAFCALEDGTTAHYLCSSAYNPSAEHGINPLDPEVALRLPEGIEPRLSPKDAAAPTLRAALDDGLLPSFEACTAFTDSLAVASLHQGVRQRRDGHGRGIVRGADGRESGGRRSSAGSSSSAPATSAARPTSSAGSPRLLAGTDAVVTSAGTRALVGAPIEPGSADLLAAAGGEHGRLRRAPDHPGDPRRGRPRHRCHAGAPRRGRAGQPAGAAAHLHPRRARRPASATPTSPPRRPTPTPSSRGRGGSPRWRCGVEGSSVPDRRRNRTSRTPTSGGRRHTPSWRARSRRPCSSSARRCDHLPD